VVVSPDGLSCWCNDSTKAIGKGPNGEVGCTYARCPGTSPLNARLNVCGPTFSNLTSDSLSVDADGNTKNANSYASVGSLLDPVAVKTCTIDRTCACSGPFTLNATSGACVTQYDLNNTRSFVFRTQGSGASKVAFVSSFTCAPGYSTASFCKDAACLNGGTLPAGSSVCLCPSGWGGDRCETDLCVQPRGRRVNSVCVCYPGYSGSYCQTGACQNGGYWNPSTLACVCLPAFDGTFCANSTCGSLGAPQNGSCVCSTNSTFASGRGCVPDPQPLCQNGGVARNYSCLCPLGYSGALCEAYACGSRGVYNRTTGRCNCSGLWRNNPYDGYNCTTSTCHPTGTPAADPNRFCLCSSGFVPLPPENAQCVSSCNNRGVFDVARGACLCQSGFAGNLCEAIAPFLNTTATLNVSTGSNVSGPSNTTSDFTTIPTPPPVVQNNVTGGSSDLGSPSGIEFEVVTDQSGNCPV
jgi:hypothetical protein